MKFRYILILPTVLFLGLQGFCNLNAAELIKKTFPESTDIGFELMNKMPFDIYVSVISIGANNNFGDKIYQVTGKNNAYELLKPTLFSTKYIAIPFTKDEIQNNRTFLAIWLNGNSKEAVKFSGFSEQLIPGTKEKIPSLTLNGKQPNFLYTFDLERTIYVSFDQEGLYPQTGRFKGKLGMTDRLYSVENNVSEQNIIKIP